MIEPPIIYRYKSFNDSGKRLLLNQELYYCSFEQLNDPAEGNISLRYDLLDEAGLREVLYRLHQHGTPNVDDRTRNADVSKRLAELLVNDKNELKQMSELLHKQVSKYVGVISLSESGNNTLMWAHYADGHKGFCMGFHTEKIMDIAKPTISGGMTYMGEVRPEELLPGYEEENFLNNIIASGFAKDKFWAYEKEFRLYKDPCIDSERAFAFPVEIVASLTFGCRMPDNMKKSLIPHCRELYPNAKLLQARLPRNSFQVEFDEL